MRLSPVSSRRVARHCFSRRAAFLIASAAVPHRLRLADCALLRARFPLRLGWRRLCGCAAAKAAAAGVALGIASRHEHRGMSDLGADVAPARAAGLSYQQQLIQEAERCLAFES